MSAPEIFYACPFCGFDEVELQLDLEKWFAISCADCGAAGPTLETREAAIAAWNKRPREQHFAKLVTDDEAAGKTGDPDDLDDDMDFELDEDEFDDDSDLESEDDD